MRGRHDQGADRTAARHQNALAEHRAAARQGMHGHREGLGQGQRGRRHVGGLLALHGIADQLVAEAALNMGQRHRTAVEAHATTLIGHAVETIGAGTARAARIDRDTIPRCHPGHVRRNLEHAAGDLVAQDHRLTQTDFAEAAMVEIMQVGPANPTPLDPDLHLTRPDGFNLPALDPQVLGSMDDDSAHYGPCKKRRFSRI